MNSPWSIAEIISVLGRVKSKGFISIPHESFRSDEGVVGQVLEREFGVPENNLHIGDLGEFELKALRMKSNTLTLCHKTTTRGLTPIQIFDRFSYVRPSKRNPDIIKKKLFVTVSGVKPNMLDLLLKPSGKNSLAMFHHQEFICEWDLTDRLEKIGRIVLVYAQTQGKTNSLEEKFHYTEAYLIRGLRSIEELVRDGAIVVDFAIDKPVDSLRLPHDRGPHIRMPKRKIASSYHVIERIL